MMNMEDGDGLDNRKRDHGARGMGVRGTEVVLAPRGETGSFTQMPSITHLHASSAKNFALAGPQYWPGHRGLSPLTGPLCTLPGPLLSLPQVPLAAPLIFQFFHFHIFHHTRFEPPISVAHQEIPRQAQDTVEENPTASRTTTTDTHTAAISSTPTPTHISHIGSDDILTVLLGGSLPGTNNAGNTEACPGQQWLTVSDPCFWISSLSSLNKLLLPGTLNFGSAIHADTFFIDCGADDVFMDAELATRLNIPLVKIPVPIKLRLADGDSSSMITHRTLPLQLHIGRHVETIGFYVTSLCHGIILGYSWLERHNPQVNWESRMVDFGSSYCLDNCCVGSTRIQGLGKPPSTSDISPKPSIPEPEPFDQTSDSVIDPDIDLSLFKDPSMDLDLGIKKPVPQVSSNTSKSVSFAETMQTEVYPFLEASPVSETPIPPEIYKEFSSVFSESQADILPLHRSFDCTINLSSSAEPSYGRIYQLTREEDKVMQEWISENLAKGFIRNSSSPYGAPCFFVKQKDKLRLCMDYRGLNKQTVKDRNPISLISEMLRTLSSGNIFTTLDIRGAYNLLRIKEGDELKTAFITKYGQFEFLVMPFGLANAPAQFQRMMNSLFRHMISKSVLVYLDDIVVYSDNLEDHKEHVRQVLQILKDNNLFCKAEKCHFYQTEIKYLGYIISPNGVSMDPSKISAVQDWPAPKKVRELQVFLGFTNFYRALVSGYSDITCHLTKLLKKDVPFSWGPEQETSFKRLKDAFARPGFLAHPNDEQPFILETDASDFAISGVLHQHDQTNTLRPVAFYSRQMNDAERNYDIYDKELLAVVESFKHWRHLLQGGLHPVTVLCDHKNLEYFMSTKKLTRRQARWSLELSEYTFTITHRPGKLNGKADSLSRREDYFLDSDQSNFQRIIDPDNVLDLQVAMADLDLHVLVHSTVLDKVFVQEADWPLIIADFLAGEDNVWIDEISEDWLELCKKELKNFRF
ncbi:hypothetical protein BASA83_006738 [Batrachochytrium salamandrivorans]|nr:hypothetical protein BASA83_006738 [Batrachochytrium salamandrivorans]